jgi:N-carbamoylputrescine amidase
MVAFPEYHLDHVKCPGPVTDAVCRAAAGANVNVVVGGWEDFPNGEFANTAFIINRQGEVVGRYCKIHRAIGDAPHCWPPTGAEGEWLMRAGDGFPTFDLDFGRIGVMTCYDGYFPESAHSLVLGGAEVIVWINGRGGAVEDFMVKTYMFTGACHMVCTNQSTGAGTMIAHYPREVLSITREANIDAFLTGELDMAMLREARVWHRMFHQRRPDLYGALTQRHPAWEAYPDLPQPPTDLEMEERRQHRSR